MGVKGAIDPVRSVMFAYAAISIGEIAIGFIRQGFKSSQRSPFIYFISSRSFPLSGISICRERVRARCISVSALLGFGTGFWAIFVTMAAEQFGTNIRVIVAY